MPSDADVTPNDVDADVDVGVDVTPKDVPPAVHDVGVGELLTRSQLSEVRGHMIRAIEILGGLIEQKGCLHEDRQEISTMGGGLRKFYCHACGETLEEEWGDLEI